MRAALEPLIEKKNLRGAEIGVAGGGHALEILQGLDMKKLYLVDVWSKYVEENNPIYVKGNTLSNAKETLKDFKQVVFIKGLSTEAAKQVKDESLDFVYIDANHQYEFVKKDILAWKPKIKEGGILGGHDFGRQGVSQAVKELLTDVISDLEKTSDWYVIC